MLDEYRHGPGPENRTPMAQGREFSEETAREIDCAVRTIVEDAFQKASGILRRERDKLDQGAQLLLQKETLGEDDLRAFRQDKQSAHQIGARAGP